MTNETETGKEVDRVEGLPLGYCNNLSLDEQARQSSAFAERVESMLNRGDFATALYTLDNAKDAGDLSALYAAATIGLEVSLLKFEGESSRLEHQTGIGRVGYDKLLELARPAIDYCRERAGRYLTRD